jgi:hypothetical protein
VIASGGEFQKALEVATEKLVSDYHIQSERLTRQQTASLIIQIIKSGDLYRLVREEGNAQQVVYVPFAEVEGLRSRVEFLEGLLKKHGIVDPNEPKPMAYHA